MQTSESINELAAALAKAQGVMGGALKDSANPFFKSKYADLESVWNACRKALSDNGLSVVQTTSGVEGGVSVTTMLAHSSGQWVRDTLPLYPKDNSPQGMGSAITYGRRYALAAMVGVFQTDDDAEAAHGRGTKAQNDPRGEAYKAEDHAEAQKMAEKFREALKVGIDEAVYDLHTQCVDRADFYIAVSAFLSAPERREIKEIINRCREAMPKVLANGRAAPAAR